jgi:pyruvate formate lyase activating enzyme
MLKEARVHIVLETSGFFDLESMMPVLDFIDLVFFDLKLMDPERHALFTGADNASILERFKSLASLRAGTALPAAMQARIPVIPGVNDDAENIAATARFIRAQGLSSVHCLPYHRLGTAKVPKLVNPPAISEFAALSPESMAAVAGLFEKEGIHAVVYE